MCRNWEDTKCLITSAFSRIKMFAMLSFWPLMRGVRRQDDDKQGFFQRSRLATTASNNNLADSFCDLAANYICYYVVNNWKCFHCIQWINFLAYHCSKRRGVFDSTNLRGNLRGNWNSNLTDKWKLEIFMDTASHRLGRNSILSKRLVFNTSKIVTLPSNKRMQPDQTTRYARGLVADAWR